MGYGKEVEMVRQAAELDILTTPYDPSKSQVPQLLQEPRDMLEWVRTTDTRNHRDILMRDLGFAGVQNFPTVGLIDGNFRANLEETGMGYGKETHMCHQDIRPSLRHSLGLLNIENIRRRQNIQLSRLPHQWD
jgi:predicted TIM-barrel enzyme